MNLIIQTNVESQTFSLVDKMTGKELAMSSNHYNMKILKNLIELMNKYEIDSQTILNCYRREKGEYV